MFTVGGLIPGADLAGDGAPVLLTSIGGLALVGGDDPTIGSCPAPGSDMVAGSGGTVAELGLPMTFISLSLMTR